MTEKNIFAFSFIFMWKLHPHPYTKNNIKNNTSMYTKNTILDVLVGFSFQSLPSYFDSGKCT